MYTKYAHSSTQVLLLLYTFRRFAVVGCKTECVKNILVGVLIYTLNKKKMTLTPRRQKLRRQIFLHRGGKFFHRCVNQPFLHQGVKIYTRGVNTISFHVQPLRCMTSHANIEIAEAHGRQAWHFSLYPSNSIPWLAAIGHTTPVVIFSSFISCHQS